MRLGYLWWYARHIAIFAVFFGGFTSCPIRDLVHFWLGEGGALPHPDRQVPKVTEGLRTEGNADSGEPSEEPPPRKFPPLPKAPCVFELLKWKADEFVVDGLRWRDIVSFAGHPLQAWSRVMSRCLQMLVSFLIDQGIGLGFAKMQGVRDQLHAAARMGALPHETEFYTGNVT